MTSLFILVALSVGGTAFAETPAADSACANLLTTLDQEFVGKNEIFENTFWSQYNGHAGVTSDDLHAAEKNVLDWLGDPRNLTRVETELAKSSLTEFDRTGLDGYRRLFAASSMTDPEALAARNANLEIENRFRAKKGKLETGYVDPKTGEFVPKQPQSLINITRTDPDAALREAAFRGLQKHEREVLDIDYVSLIKQRNAFARALGYPDFYEYKLKTFEGLTKAEVFRILDELEERSRGPAEKGWAEFNAKFGEEGRKPWNTKFFQRGDLSQRVAKYFPASEALIRWARTFDSIGVDFKGARLKIDLLDREKKYNNGFMRVPRPSFKTAGGFVPAIGNFTATADLSRPTAGHAFATTLHHEGGHAAHFANSGMPGAAYLTEFPPSSIALAELQAMFLDSFLEDPFWLARYAQATDGEFMPDELIEESVLDTWRSRAMVLRNMMITPFFERALYETPEDELTPDRVREIARAVEHKLVFQDADRPAITIPHTQSSESAAYYHSYVLAEVAAEQLHARFRQKYGSVVDNPHLAEDLKKYFWEPGNSLTFLQMVENFLGRPFSTDAVIDNVNRTEEQVKTEVRASIAASETTPIATSPLKLNLEVQMEDGTDVITSTDGGKSFERMAGEYADWVRSRTPGRRPSVEPRDERPADSRPVARSNAKAYVDRFMKFVTDIRRHWDR